MRGEHTLRLALLCAATAMWPAIAPAQTVYRCGNSYSQTPCPGGNPVQVDDARDRTQRAQAEAATQRDLRAAIAHEKSRQREETQQAREARARLGREPVRGGDYDERLDGRSDARNGPYFTARSTQAPAPRAKEKADKQGDKGMAATRRP